MNYFGFYYRQLALMSAKNCPTMDDCAYIFFAKLVIEEKQKPAEN